MTIQFLPDSFTICRVVDYSEVRLDEGYCWIGRTNEENSLVCLTQSVPSNTIERSDGWRVFRIAGILDFSLVGILAEIANILAEQEISIVALSTYNTDYVLIREERLADAIQALRGAAYDVEEL